MSPALAGGFFTTSATWEAKSSGELYKLKDLYRQNKVGRGSYSSKGLIVLGKVTFLWDSEDLRHRIRYYSWRVLPRAKHSLLPCII